MRLSNTPFRFFVATALCFVRFVCADLSPLLAAEPKKPSDKITIEKKWEFSFPSMWKEPSEGIISPNEQFYFRSGVLLDLTSGKTLKSNRDATEGFYDETNQFVTMIVEPIDRKLNKNLNKVSLIHLEDGRLLSEWKFDGRLFEVHPLSATRILALVNNPETRRTELVVFGDRQTIMRIDWHGSPSPNRFRFRVSQDRKTLALVNITRATMDRWDLREGKRLSTSATPWPKHSEQPEFRIDPGADIAISPDLKMLAYKEPTARTFGPGAQLSKIVIVEVSSGKSTQKLAGSVGASFFQFCQNNKNLLSQGAVQYWELSTGKNLVAKAYREELQPQKIIGLRDDLCDMRILVGHREQKYAEVEDAAITADGKKIAVIDKTSPGFGPNVPEIRDYLIHVLSVPSFKAVAKAKFHGRPPYYMRFSPNGSYLILQRKVRSCISG